MKSKKIISLISAVALLGSLVLQLPLSVYAQQSVDTKTATQSGTADQLVEVNLTDSSISYGTLNISNQATANGRTESGVKYVIFESQYDLGTADPIVFNEGATNSNASYNITSAGETYPATGGLDSTSWIFLRDSAGTSYVQPHLTGALSAGGGGVTMPSGVTEVGSRTFTQYYYTTADSGVTWTRNSQTIYVALGNNGRLYVSNSATLSDTQYFTAKGEARSDSFNNGNSMVLTSTFPTAATDTVTLDFGYNVPWDNTQGNANKTLYTLVDMPEHAATGHAWQWNLNITGEFQSNP